MGSFEGFFVGFVDGLDVGPHSSQPAQTAKPHFTSQAVALEEQNDKQSHRKNIVEDYYT